MPVALRILQQGTWPAHSKTSSLCLIRGFRHVVWSDNAAVLQSPQQNNTISKIVTWAEADVCVTPFEQLRGTARFREPHLRETAHSRVHVCHEILKLYTEYYHKCSLFFLGLFEVTQKPYVKQQDGSPLEMEIRYCFDTFLTLLVLTISYVQLDINNQNKTTNWKIQKIHLFPLLPIPAIASKSPSMAPAHPAAIFLKLASDTALHGIRWKTIDAN